VSFRTRPKAEKCREWLAVSGQKRTSKLSAPPSPGCGGWFLLCDDRYEEAQATS